MWCVGDLTPEYRERMYKIPDLYAIPFNKNCRVTCVGKKSKQLFADSPARKLIMAKPGTIRKIDHEYIRKGTCNLFISVDLKGGSRHVVVTERRTKADFVNYITSLRKKYQNSKQLYIILDNLNHSQCKIIL
jgi:hypothetical protein